MFARFSRLVACLCVVWVMSGVTTAHADDVTLNFKNADIGAFIEFVAGFSGKNFLVDNRVKGKVTVVSPTPMSEQEAYEVFLSVLEINGFATVHAGPITKIVPRAESKQRALPVRSGIAAEDDEMVTQVIRLRFANGQQLVALIRPLISPNSHLVAYPRGNMLLLTDTASNVRRIQRILDLLDRKDAVGVQMFSLQHASADKLAATLAKLYPAGPATPGGSVKAIAHQPGNILVVVAAPQIINEIGSLIEKLDVSPKSDSGRLQVRYLKHATAVDIAKVISELIGGQVSAGSPGGKAPSSPLFSGDVKVVAEPATNALLITADPSDISSINRIIDKLDILRRQVLVEAMIVEVSTNASEQFGIEWRGTGDFTQPGTTVLGGTTFTGSGGGNINTVAANPLAAGSGLIVGLVEGTINFGGNTFLNLGALARALQTQADTNVLSTPNLLTMDNEEAEIVVGQNVPFLTGSSTTQGGVTNPFQTIERKDIGLTLRIKPQITDGDTVRLQLYQEMSSIAVNAGVQGTDLITNKRSIKTVVLANDGQIIVLGGLMRDDNTSSVQRVPCIGSIPIIGEPFKFTDNTHRKTNLMVFLRPHIIKSSDQIQALTNQKYSDIKGLYEEPIKGGTILFPQVDRRLPKDMSPNGIILKKQPEQTSKDGE